MLLKTILPTILTLAALHFFCDLDTVLLTLSFAFVHITMSRICSQRFSEKPLLGYPIWAYYASIFQQLIVLPPIAGLLLWRESADITGWMFSVTEVTRSKYIAHTDLLKTLSLVSTASAMIRDYWSYGNTNKWGFIVHHLITSIACAYCLAIPVYSGAVIFVGIFAEFTSLFYNIRVLYPSNFTQFMHVIFMGLSNVLGIFLARLMWMQVTDEMYYYWKIGFTCIVALLCTFRFAGFFLDA